MKLRKTIISAILCIITLFSFSALLISVIANDFQLDNEIIIKQFYKSINDDEWEIWTSLWTGEVRNMMQDMIPYSESKNGVFNINSVEIVEIKKVDNNYAPKYKELEHYYDDSKLYMCFLVGLDINAYEDSEYYFTGINYDLVVLVNNNDNWYIGGISSGNPELLQKEGDPVLIQDAINLFQEKTSFVPVQDYLDSDIIAPSYKPGDILTSNIVEPSFIRVGIGHLGYDEKGNPIPIVDYTYGDVDFKMFYTNVAQNEFGNESYGENAAIASALVVKMAGWYYKYSSYRKQRGFDVIGGYDMAFVPSTSPTEITTRVKNAIQKVVYNYSFVYSVNSNSTYSIVPVYYGSSSYANPAPYRYSGYFAWDGADWLGDNGYSWQDIIHYFFDEASNGTVTHPIFINISIPSSTAFNSRVYNIRLRNSGKYVTVSYAGITNGTYVQQYTHDPNKANQEWQLISAGSGEYKIQDKNSGMLLSVDASSGADNAIIWIWQDDGTTGQRFKLRNNNDGTYSILTKTSNFTKVIGVDLSINNGLNDGAQLRQYPDLGTNNQRFIFQLASNNKVPETVYNLSCQRSGKYVSVLNKGTINGTKVQQFSESSIHSQYWEFVYLGAGLYKIKDINSGKLLSVTDNLSGNSVHICIRSDDGGSGQIFKIRKNADSSYTFLTKSSGYTKVLDVSLAAPPLGGSGYGEGDQLNQYTDYNTNNQRFYLE
ncbi:MAG: RICIN domain-containing protein [Eubacteriales bacterium]|nr:RICIN domain-containing protein [Eubacteriales bacterium]MDD4475530.1 RICIN domain-containing protein [Eubacteriales bacterium]